MILSRRANAPATIAVIELMSSGGSRVDRGTIEKLLPNFSGFAPLGQGAYGSVYEVFDHGAGKRVALKVCWHDLHLEDPARVRERFCREFDLLCRARSSDNIVPVYKRDTVVVPEARRMMLWYTMERCRDSVAGSLDSLALSARVAASTQLFAAVSHIAALGIIHRDLKPQNLFLVRTPPEGSTLVKLGDFGIARSTLPGDHLGLTLTATDRVPGTLLYLAPEALETAEHRGSLKGDQYATGVVVYQMLTRGTLPYGSPTDSPLKLMRKKSLGNYTPLVIPDFNGDLEPLDRVLSRILDPDPSKRYRQVQEADRAFSTALLNADLPREEA